VPGTRYPATLFVTGDADTRVAPLHARKMAALMQNSGSPNPVLIRYHTAGGHSGGEPLSVQVANEAEIEAPAVGAEVMRKLVIAILPAGGVQKNTRSCSLRPPPPPRRAASSTTYSATAVSTASTMTGASPDHQGDDLLALASAPSCCRGEVRRLERRSVVPFDEDARTSWTGADNQYSDPTVVELADRGVVKTIVIDDAMDDYDGRHPEGDRVECRTPVPRPASSDRHADAAARAKDGQRFAVNAQVPAVGSADGQEHARRRHRATVQRPRLRRPPLARASAERHRTYETDAGKFNLKQNRTSVTGCYEPAPLPLVGGWRGVS